MDVNYLLKDELEFELACRGIQNVKKVISMKKILKEIFMEELGGQSTIKLNVPLTCINDPLSEIITCESKYQVSSLNLSEIMGRPERSSVKRLLSRLSHLLNRINLIVPIEKSQIDRHTTLLKNVREALAKIETLQNIDDDGDDAQLSDDDKEILYKSLGENADRILEKIESYSITNDINLVGQQNIAKGTENIQTSTSDFAKPSRGIFSKSSTIDLNSCVSRKLIPVKDWGVKYSGKGDTSINSFLERVDELKEARNANDDDLFRYAIDLFDGDALIWFRANRHNVSNWKGLVSLLLDTFQSPYYQEDLLEEIKNRTQSKFESVNIYLAIMQNMFNRLPIKLDDEQKVTIILRNLQPHFQKALCRETFNSVAELGVVLRIVERTKINCDRFKEPTNSSYSLEPDLAFQGSSHVHAVNYTVRNSNNERNEMKCWNCRNTGHSFRNCNLPRQRMFCYKCGKFGQTIDKCPCSGRKKQGNDSAEVPSPVSTLPLN